MFCTEIDVGCCEHETKHIKHLAMHKLCPIVTTALYNSLLNVAGQPRGCGKQKMRTYRFNRVAETSNAYSYIDKCPNLPFVYGPVHYK
jgi:hypothetical protein